MGKHPKLIRPEIGRYARNEWAIHGTNCSTIQQFAKDIIKTLGDKYRICYIDTDHRSFKEELHANYLEDGAIVGVSDKKQFQQIDLSILNPDFDYKFILQQADIVLVNGNHHTANKQIVFLDQSKVESLERKASLLTDIKAFIPVDSYNVVPTHILDELSSEIALPIYEENAVDGVAQLIDQELHEKRAGLKALILAGGKSERMGVDKGAINYHGLEQREHMAKLAKEYTDEVYISCRAGQASEITSEFSILEDRIDDMGPFGAILTAFMTDPNSAWLVLACDLPLIDSETLKQLTANRNSSSYATCFRSPENDLPEPLIAIWEPRAYMRLLQFMSIGHSCPRKVLINSDVEQLEAINPQALMNANTPEDLDHAKTLINAGS